MIKRIILVAALGVLTTKAIASPPTQAPAAPERVPNYADEGDWLCLPGPAGRDPCALPLSTAELTPGGFGATQLDRRADDPPIDCFYIYPTVSRDPGLNSDMQAGSEENGAAMVQFARFASVCRTFAPLYRQATVASIAASFRGQDPVPILNAAYADVLAAWRNYLAHRNNGRPFVLIGHSQGTIHLMRLLADEIEGKPEAGRMLSALLLGFNVEVPVGQVTGGSFRTTPLCTRAGQTGCVITYVTFRAASPPPEGALFGRATAPGRTVACTNPAALGSDRRVPLTSYWFTRGASQAIVWSSAGPAPASNLRSEGLVSAACVNDGPLGYLAVTVNADPADARTDEIPGDVSFAGTRVPGWGLHLADVPIAQGDLIRAVEAQRDAFLSASR